MLNSKYKVGSPVLSQNLLPQKNGIKMVWQNSYGHSKSGVVGVIEKIEEAGKNERSWNYVTTHCQQVGITSSLTSPAGTPASNIEDKVQKKDVILPPSSDEDETYRDSVSVNSDRDSVSEASAVSKVNILTTKVKSELAYLLTSPQHMWDHFFSGIITDAAADAVDQNVKEDRSKFLRSVEVRCASKRGEQRFASVLDLPLKLILTPLKQCRRLANTAAHLLELKFGPLHAALQVGNVVLEWNKTSLVIPHLCDYENQVMEIDMQRHSNWVDYTSQHHSKMKGAAEKLNFPEQIELIYMVTSQKKQLIDALIKVIMKYNTRYYYNIFSRNCQHFVCDALRALQVEEPTAFTGGLKKYFESLRKGRTPSVPERFQTHHALDEYVLSIQREKRAASMPQHDLEFILTLYLHFHLMSKSENRYDCRALEEWECEEANCRINDIELLIKKESLHIHLNS